MDDGLREWLKAGEYLPDPLKDFYDQKRIFKRIQEMVDKKEWHGDPPNWVTSHIYTIDFFLWFMAVHGYTLQRSRMHRDNRPPFCDLDATMKDFQERQMRRLIYRYVEKHRPDCMGGCDVPNVEPQLELFPVVRRGDRGKFPVGIE